MNHRRTAGALLTAICAAPFLLGNDGGGCGGDTSGPSTEVDSGVAAIDAGDTGGGGIDAMPVPGPADAPATSCTASISGGLSASDACSGSLFQHYKQRNVVDVNFGFELGSITVSAGVLLPGDLEPGLYTIADANTSGGVQAIQNQPPPLQQWVSDTAGGGHGIIGTWSLEITSAVVISTVGDVVSYAAHGTMTGTLPPLNPPDPMNPPADVTFSATF